MITKKRILLLSLITILMLPLWMWLAWLLTPKKQLVAAIVNKTVLSKTGQEHLSFTWILNNNRFSKNSSTMYNASNDYFGFFPLDSQRYMLKGLERFSTDQLNKLSNDADLVYLSDTYGIYETDWYNSRKSNGVIYGGLSTEDLQLLHFMKKKRKLIMAEFNTIGSSTHENARKQFEGLFSMQWTGWTARYFPVLDTTKTAELPAWLIKNYKRQHKGNWHFRNAGIVFVNSSGTVLVLEDKVHLTDPMSYIRSTQTGQKELDLPEVIEYPFWFDVVVPNTSINTIAATFEIHVNQKGKEAMKRNGIPHIIPAVIFHKEKDYRFYYFSGDFCNNPISLRTSYFKGISTFKGLMNNPESKEDRSPFFWDFYHPMMKRILNDYYNIVKDTNN